MNGVPKRFWVILASSLALNLFCLGVFAARHVPLRAAWLRGDHSERNEHSFLFRSGLRDASPEVQAILKEQHVHMRENMHALSDARERARESLTADHFDVERVNRAFADVRARGIDAQEQIHVALIEIAQKLNYGQRTRMAGALWRSPFFRRPPL
jgi:uncharacterized membrane protein